MSCARDIVRWLRSYCRGGEPRQILVARGVTKRFPGVLALDNVDFDVSRR